jgi:transcriptional regulator with XRE-family HTH domain
MTSAQCRAARGLVNWTVRDLAERSGLHRNTITNVETGSVETNPATVTAIRAALEAAGVEFIAENGGGPGVRLRKAGA